MKRLREPPVASHRKPVVAILAILVLATLIGGLWWNHSSQTISKDCVQAFGRGIHPVASERISRFLGKVSKEDDSCRGGEVAVANRQSPWVDWANYWGVGERRKQSDSFLGVNGALVDLEYQRMELIKFNLLDNNGTYESYVKGRDSLPGASLKVWPEMRLLKNDPNYQNVGGDGEQLCKGDLIRFRTLTGFCNDIRNPIMGSTHQLFGRMVEFDSTFPDLGKSELSRNRHSDRLSLLEPDPAVISRKLFTRIQSHPEKCRAGLGLDGESKEAECDYRKANTFNVLAAFWIQFMTHDWFSHLEEGHNQPSAMTSMGCKNHLVGNQRKDLLPEDVQSLGCRPDDAVDKAYIAEESDPSQFSYKGKSYLSRAYKTTRNDVTAWWDASQLYGYDATSVKRVKRDPSDRAKLLLVSDGAVPSGYLPLLVAGDPMNDSWTGQEATAFADNWNIGLSFYHNLFAREHNAFVDAFRKQAALTPAADSGLRDPSHPDRVIRFADVTADDLFEVARLVIAAEIAKIHTIEWTSQLLYNEPLYLAMRSNWYGFFGGNEQAVTALRMVERNFGESHNVKEANEWYSVFASGPGIFGLGSRVYKDDNVFALFNPNGNDIWDLRNPNHVNGGTNHFGSPFNFPEEFVTVYRLHALVPDLVEYRDLHADPNSIQKMIPMVQTFRGLATAEMRSGGMANWALSMGRQRSGALTLQNQPQFLQNLPMPRLGTKTNMLDVPALDVLRDRERGVPRFNEFRRQLGLRQLTSFDDFVDRELAPGPERSRQEQIAATLREVYGLHRCDSSKVITDAQLNADGSRIDDCLGHANGSIVDNIEDLDTVVGWLAEPVRPHGFAISETQFQVFIINASRRLFSDRFFTSSFRPEFYSNLGIRWVMENGPDGKIMETDTSNGHSQEVSPLKRVLLRNIPELAPELRHVVNVFDPWARDHGKYYSLDWKPRAGAEPDSAFSH
jgi:hypothetical protein